MIEVSPIKSQIGVICISKHSESQITIGKIYILIDKSTISGSEYYDIINDDERLWSYQSNRFRFETLEEYRARKINEIIINENL